MENPLQSLDRRDDSETAVNLPMLSHATCGNYVDLTSGQDFSQVFKDNDVTICSESDECCDSLGDGSFANSSFNNESTEFFETEEPSHPYVPFSVEEVSSVTTLSGWSNCNVRVIGNLSPTRLDGDLWALNSIGEEGGPFSILVNVKLLMTVPTVGTAVQIFGTVEMIDGADTPKPHIMAKFFRDVSCFDLSYYNKSLEELKKFIPHFIKKRKINPEGCLEIGSSDQ